MNHNSQVVGLLGSVRVVADSALTVGSPPSAIDGVTMAHGDRVLATAQSDASENRIWRWTSSALVEPVNFPNCRDGAFVPHGTRVYVAEGTSYAGSLWAVTSDGSGDSRKQPGGIFGTDDFTVERADLRKVALICEEQTTGTDGGTFTSGAWRTRTINTEESDDHGIVSIASNEFTIKSHPHLIEWSTPGFRCHRHISRLYDVTGTTVVAYGTAELAGTDEAVSNRSLGFAIVFPGTTNAYRIEHRCETTRATNGLGVASSLGSERYTMVKISRLD